MLQPPFVNPFADLTTEQLSAWLAQFRANLGTATILNDLIVKRLIGERGRSEARLISLINAVRNQMGHSEIVEVDILDPENRPEHITEKTTRFDIKARDDKGSWYNVEIQRAPQLNFVSRTVHYNSQMHGRQITSGQGYDCICPTISIILTAHTLFKNMPYPFLSFFLMSNTEVPQILTYDVQFYFIQLGPQWSLDACSNLNHDLVDWMLTLNYPKTEESIMQQVLRKQVVIADGFEDVSRFVADPSARMFVDNNEKQHRDYISDVDYAKHAGIAEGKLAGIAEGKREGIAEGEARGKIEGQREIVINMQRNGLDIEAIAGLTKLSNNEIKMLLNTDF